MAIRNKPPQEPRKQLQHTAQGFLRKTHSLRRFVIQFEQARRPHRLRPSRIFLERLEDPGDKADSSRPRLNMVAWQGSGSAQEGSPLACSRSNPPCPTTALCHSWRAPQGGRRWVHPHGAPPWCTHLSVPSLPGTGVSPVWERRRTRQASPPPREHRDPSLSRAGWREEDALLPGRTTAPAPQGKPSREECRDGLGAGGSTENTAFQSSPAAPEAVLGKLPSSISPAPRCGQRHLLACLIRG